MKSYKYIVNEKKRTVVCLVTVKVKDEYGREATNLYRGIAKCNPDDVFDAEIGKLLARRRALLSEHEQELNEIEWCWTDEEIDDYIKRATKAKKSKEYLRRKISELRKEINDTARPE